MSDRTKIIKVDKDPQGFNYAIEFPKAFEIVFDDYGYEFIRYHCEIYMAILIADLLTGKNKQFLKINDLFFVMKLEEIPYYREILTVLLRVRKAKTRNHNRKK